MPKTKQQCQDIKDTRKKQILDIALVSFCTIGYDATKIDDIAKRVGISHGLLYHYYANKEDLFFDLCKLSKRLFYDDFVTILLDETLDTVTIITQLLTNLLATTKDDNKTLMYYLTLNITLIKHDYDICLQQYLAAKDDKAKNQYVNSKKVILARLTEILKCGIENNTLRQTNLQQLVSLFRTIINGVITTKVSDILRNSTYNPPSVETLKKLFIKE